jgi:hypothetical protein
MKKYLIFEKNEDGSYGRKLLSYSDNKARVSTDLPHTLLPPHAEHFELPEGADEDTYFPTLIPGDPGVEAIPDKWTKDGEPDRYSMPLLPEVVDDSWAYVPGTEAQIQRWAKDGEEDVYSAPTLPPQPDTSWTHYPAIPYAPEKWTKDGEADLFEQPYVEGEFDEEGNPLADMSWQYVTPQGSEEYWVKENVAPVYEQPMLPAELDPSWTYITGSEALPEKWTKDGEEDVFEQPYLPREADETWAFVEGVPGVEPTEDRIELAEDAALVASKAIKLKQKMITDKYNQMNDEVIQQMTAVFGTSRTDSATAYERTWELMKQDPAEWIFLDLKDDNGDILDTEAKVVSYASAKINAVRDYGKWRMQRIQQFKDERDQILGE